MQTLKLDGKMRELAASLKDEPSMLVFGRGQNYATALETALKVCVFSGSCHHSLCCWDGCTVLELLRACVLACDPNYPSHQSSSNTTSNYDFEYQLLI